MKTLKQIFAVPAALITILVLGVVFLSWLVLGDKSEYNVDKLILGSSR